MTTAVAQMGRLHRKAAAKFFFYQHTLPKIVAHLCSCLQGRFYPWEGATREQTMGRGGLRGTSLVLCGGLRHPGGHRGEGGQAKPSGRGTDLGHRLLGDAGGLGLPSFLLQGKFWIGLRW